MAESYAVQAILSVKDHMSAALKERRRRLIPSMAGLSEQ